MTAWTSRKKRAAFRLVNEVCQLGRDAPTWTDRLMRGLAELFDARMIGLAWSTLPESPGGFSQSEIQLHHGFTETEVRLFADAYCGADNSFQSEFLRRVVNIPARFVTVNRQDVMTDSEWYAMPVVQSVHRQLDIDANLTSFFVALKWRRIFGIAVHRSWNHPQFTSEDRRQLRWIHLELARAWRQRINAPNDADAAIAALTPRLRQVLWLLCLGRSEKEIAREIDLSPHTVHCHVRELHKALGVHSRSELLVRALPRGGMDPVALPDRRLNEFRRADSPSAGVNAPA